jgi:ferredoxin-NADP reductase
MPIYPIKLKGRIQVAERTMAFLWEKPKGFTHQAGQFADFTQINPPDVDEEGATRGFTLSSAPSEPFLMNTTRLRDTAFKRNLRVLPFGTVVTLDAPYGSFLLHEDDRIDAVFLAGGIGVTPARSIVVEATITRNPHHIYLFHSNRRPEDVPFFSELTSLEKRNLNFKYIPTITRPEKSAIEWSGEIGYIDMAMLRRHLDDVSKPTFYLSGPQQVVLALKQMLIEGGIREDNIRTEEFTGYDRTGEPVKSAEKVAM